MTIYHALKDYQEVMTRGDYLVFDTPLTCRFIGRFFRFENQKALLAELATSKYFQWIEEGQAEVTMKHFFNRQLAKDAFTLRFQKIRKSLLKAKTLEVFVTPKKLCLKS